MVSPGRRTEGCRLPLSPTSGHDWGAAVVWVLAAELSRNGVLTDAQMTGSASFVSAPWRYERIEGAGHWMQLERPDEINALLVDFLPAP